MINSVSRRAVLVAMEHKLELCSIVVVPLHPKIFAYV
jgi:hypothetical protein